MKNIQAVLNKYNHFRDARIHSIHKPTENSVVITLMILDDDGMVETDEIKITFTDVQKSRLLVNHALAFLDMMSGISIIYEREQYGFAIGRCSAMLNVISAPLYVVSHDIELEEKAL